MWQGAGTSLITTFRDAKPWKILAFIFLKCIKYKSYKNKENEGQTPEVYFLLNITILFSLLVSVNDTELRIQTLLIKFTFPVIRISPVSYCRCESV